MEEITTKQGLSRRNFLSSAALGLGALAVGSLAGCAPQASGNTTATTSATGSNVPSSWDGEYDVIVCGGGGSGLTAAYSALENGAKTVLVLEKGTACGGTTALAEGAVQASGTKWQKELGKVNVENDSPEKHLKYWMTDAEGLVDESLVRVMADNAADNLEWMADSFGITFSQVFGAYPVPYLPEEYVADRIHLITDANDKTKTGGVVWTTNAQKAIEEKGGEIKTKAEVATLYLDGDNGCVGVGTADKKNYKANKGVVLAMSGIEHNEELAFKFNPQQYWDLKSQNVITANTNTGDGIKMGMEAGADVACFHGCVDLLLETWSYTNNTLPEVPYILVNMRGNRFVREDTTYAYHCRAIYNESMQWGGEKGCTWMIMDNKMTSCDQAACTWTSANPKNTLEADLASGTLIKADSIEALAAAIEIDAATLKATVDKWNASVAAGSDADTGRVKQLTALDEAPFYAWKTVNSNIGSIGGLKINTEAAILGTDGEAIPHLFGAGTNTGGWLGPYYPGSGTCLQGTLNWGRIAGKSAATA